MLKTRIVSSMEKCFLDTPVEAFEAIAEERIFQNQKYSFQVLLAGGKEERIPVLPKIEAGELTPYITVREVVPVPVDFPAAADHDDGYLRDTPGLYPDLLRPLHYDGHLRLFLGQTRALWIDIAPEGALTGRFPITVKLFCDGALNYGIGGLLAEETFTVEIMPVSLPPQELIFTQWFYADCLADFYQVPVFSPRHWEICENFMRTAVSGGRNMMLTPVFGYLLDTFPGRHRTHVQLVDVFSEDGRYRFGYRNLDKWLDLCKKCGVEYYEISHLFTQWGASFAPMVEITENGEKKRCFGWETDGASPEYAAFLRAFLPDFLQHMRARGEDRKCWFHLSDEPPQEHLEHYKKAKAIVADLLEGYPILDALSNYDFYAQGLVNRPVPVLQHLQPFLENHVPDLWTYYCGGNPAGYSNAFLAMPSARTRFIGTQFYQYDIKGFLHWGYNFYHNQWSFDAVDPFFNSGGEGFAPAGDCYWVYPEKDGTPLESLRFCAFYQGLEDLRAMRLCEKYYGRQRVKEEIEAVCGPVAFSSCVNETAVMRRLRKRIDDMIFEAALK